MQGVEKTTALLSLLLGRILLQVPSPLGLEILKRFFSSLNPSPIFDPFTPPVLYMGLSWEPLLSGK